MGGVGLRKQKQNLDASLLFKMDFLTSSRWLFLQIEF
jgi:hypothetical protein